MSSPRRALAWISPLSISLLLLLLPGAGGAQEQAEDDTVEAVGQIGLTPSANLRRAKRITSKEQWAWTLVGSAATGYDTNSFESPGSDEEDTFLSTVGLALRAERRWGEADKLILEASGGYSPHTRTSNLDEHHQQGTVSYWHEFDAPVHLRLFGSVEHENDHAVDIEGDDLERDFEHMAYRVKPSLYVDLGASHQLRFSYFAKRKDYFETPALDSLDWWRHGPGVRWRAYLGESVTFDVIYDFSVQNYDEELAALADGTEVAGNDEEEHFFHEIGSEVDWELAEWLTIATRYEYRIKDDRFDGFESYGNHGAELGFEVSLPGGFGFGLMGSFDHRDYANRPGEDPGEELEYDRFGARATVSHQLSDHFALFAVYDFGHRDTNRETGTSYLDYETHRALTGFTVGF